MPFRASVLYAVVAVTLAAAACAGFEKSENVLSPTIAGPIPGVTIGLALPLDPKDGKNIAIGSQAIDLLVQNAPTNGQRPLTYLFEVASDVNFNSMLFSRAGITPGENNRTSIRLPDSIAISRTYFWRVRAMDGANTGPYSGSVHFNIFTPIVIDKPIPREPPNGVTLPGLQPTFLFMNAPRSGPVGAIVYTIEVADSDGFGNKFAVWQIAEQPTQTKLDAPSPLPADRLYFWRVTAGGPWSNTQTFRTPVVKPPVTPSPTPVPPNCTLPQPTPYQSLQCARNAYPRPMAPAHRGQLMNQVAWLHRAEGWGMHAKPGGNNCPQPKTGTLISCDILVDAKTGGVYDVLLDEEEPTWGYKGPINTMANFVAPVQP